MINVTIKTFILVVTLLLSCSGDALAQETRYADRCAVGVADVTGIKTFDLESDTAPKLTFKEMGTFDTVIYEEELTTKSFRLPNTKLYVVASVWYTDESMAGKNSQDSVSLQLTISPTPKRDILSGLQFAEAEVLSKNFEVARVTTIYKLRRRSFYIVMECRKHTRP
ncbi:MAG TPA: hypothetical protein VFQ47_01170 [Nitrososphaera sp.]|jgi:hypothetical protein|nr:hypothetical protein [Nitrososphaera sp.]